MKFLTMQTIKSFLSKNLLKILASIIAYFTPLKPLLLATTLFCLADFITGIVAAKKTNIPIDSKKMKRKVYDLFFYMAALVLSFVFYTLFKDFVDFPIYRVTAFIILSVEFWSNMENISKITNIPLLGKDKFIDVVNKFKNTNNDTTRSN